ncbi:GDP-L-fucose synthase [Colwellia sp. MB02u-18]|uniref:GDP-L-fucose synthase family protein n=1 Tax=unclassified Colwellia TaxID=196834 RepID=UPI0015F3EFA2|nr:MULTISPECIES: GDP-L-fucose synthase [unclassified Colwellia]MBA6224528.1 GDP-L-fucose synthase [Colwellia sp. MB3u-45]MBA6268160.1 GDP-L-fucose synthase [Colwellia sp. MB3u-43]MBA6322612.1 GDP-L-fucose synthase [Colwellia sp. MB02u-19]MBA6326190.1 GDP-L-fucose synthase [Colwellia sp. MB02u-18]MBA6331649.1 GDP-L-fucose synthase [Colwellia sp. MB02u-12]
MKILLTGANGMVGRNILEIAKLHDHDFLSPSSTELNLLDANSVRQYINTYKPDMIIHAAGIVGGIQANMAQPVKFLVDNMQMGLNILTAANASGITKFLNLSSSCMYPRDALNPLAEDLILKGELEPTNEGYALAKVTSTRLCEYICKENSDLLYKTIIPCNLYGRFDKFDPNHSHMIPAVIRKIDEAKKNNLKEIDIWGDGEARREFMYAEDLADFIFYSINNFEKMPQNLNVGLGTDFTINEYYQTVSNVVGYKGKFKHDLTKPVGMKQKLIDDKKLKEFGWSYKTELETGIQKTYKFYLSEYCND